MGPARFQGAPAFDLMVPEGKPAAVTQFQDRCIRGIFVERAGRRYKD
jgi:hypothetical protein